MRLIIDGDATPSINKIEKVAEKYNIKCYIFCDFTHNITSEYSEIFTISKGFQNVDMAILKFVTNNDIVITNDYGLASLSLNKAKVISCSGLEYNKDNIDILLMNRYLNLKQKRKKGPKKRTNEDDINLIKTLENIILKYDIINEGGNIC